MGCGSSSESVAEPSFAETEAEIRRNMKKAVLEQNPLSEEQALSKLAQFSSGNIRSHCEVVERAPQTAFTSDDGQQTFLSGVLYAVKLRETDAESVKRLLRGMLARGADPNKLGHDGHAAIHIVAT